jgi:hypothetical protein
MLRTVRAVDARTHLPLVGAPRSHLRGRRRRILPPHMRSSAAPRLAARLVAKAEPRQVVAPSTFSIIRRRGSSGRRSGPLRSGACPNRCTRSQSTPSRARAGSRRRARHAARWPQREFAMMTAALARTRASARCSRSSARQARITTLQEFGTSEVDLRRIGARCDEYETHATSSETSSGRCRRGLTDL